MGKEGREKKFIKRPVYKGGPKALRAFVGKQLRYPESARRDRIEGTVSLRYTIDHRGKVVDVNIISGLTPDCNREAERVVKLLKFRVPKNRGLRVLFHKNIQIHFRLSEKEEPPASGLQVSYSLKADKSTPKEEKTEKGYSYRIDLPDDQ